MCEYVLILPTKKRKSNGQTIDSYKVSHNHLQKSYRYLYNKDITTVILMDIQLEREYAIDNMGDSIGQAIEKATDEDRLEDAKALFQEWCVLDNIAESENYQFVFLRNFTIPEGLQ